MDHSMFLPTHRQLGGVEGKFVLEAADRQSCFLLVIYKPLALARATVTQRQH